jgi:phage terminase small subunit
MELTDKQQRFVDEYLIDLNATQAAIRAGYSEDSARQIASENLSKPDIQDAIQAAMEARSERTQIDQDWVLKRLALLADAKTTEVVSWDAGGVYFKNSDELTPEQAYLISEVSLEETIKEVKGTKDNPDGELILKRQKRLKLVSDSTKAVALEKIGKHLGMFKEQLQLSGDPDSPIKHDLSAMSAQDLKALLRNGSKGKS